MNACRLLLVLVVGLPLSARAAGCDRLSALDWLLGDWVATGEKSNFHESWTQVSPTTYEGAGVERASADGKLKGAEVLRLVQMADGVYYVSKVTHNELPVAFRLTECDAGRFAFVNTAHDFPRRLDYAHGEGGRLTVRVSDGGAKGFTLDFTRAPSLSTPEAAVLAAEDARFAAMVAASPAEMHRWLAADLRYVHSNGDVETRDELIDSIEQGRIRYLALEPGEREVTFLDSAAALVQAPAHLSVLAGGTALEFDIRYLAVYVLQEGTWQLHAWQSLRLQ